MEQRHRSNSKMVVVASFDGALQLHASYYHLLLVGVPCIYNFGGQQTSSLFGKFFLM